MLARAHLIQPAGPGRYGMHDLLALRRLAWPPVTTRDQARQAALTGLFDYYLAACAAAMDHLASRPNATSGRPAARGRGRPAASVTRRPPGPGWTPNLATLVAVAAYTAGHGWPGHTIRLAATLLRYLDGDHNIEGLTIGGHALNAARGCGDRAAQARALTRMGNFHCQAGPPPAGRRLSPASARPCPRRSATGLPKPIAAL